MVSKVCSRSQGHPPGARSRSMMLTARSKRSPVEGISPSTLNECPDDGQCCESGQEKQRVVERAPVLALLPEVGVSSRGRETSAAKDRLNPLRLLSRPSAARQIRESGHRPNGPKV